MNKLSENTIKEIAKLYTDGFSAPKIAKMLNIKSVNTIYSIIKGNTYKKYQPQVQYTLSFRENNLKLKESNNILQKCTQCLQDLPKTTEFFPPRKNTKKGFSHYCRNCKSIKNNLFYKEQKNLVLKYYSDGIPQCCCCYETIIEFLTVDHINGKGIQHRKEIRKTTFSIYRWLVLNNFPPGFRILCMNCNLATSRNRDCPHQMSNIKS